MGKLLAWWDRQKAMTQVLLLMTGIVLGLPFVLKGLVAYFEFLDWFLK